MRYGDNEFRLLTRITLH